MKSTRLGLFAASAVVIGGLFSGCSKTSAPGSGTSSTPPEITIASVPPGLKSPFHTGVKAGCERVAKEYGWHLDVQAAEKETDFNGQISIVEQMVNRGVNAITICAINDKAIGTAIEKANSKNIPIFINNGISPVDVGKVTQYIGYNQYEGGRKCGEYAVKLLNGKGKIAIMQGIPGFHNTERSSGFKSVIKKYPGIVIVQEPVCDWLREKATNNAAQTLQRYPDIKLIFGISDEMAIGASLAAQEKGLNIYTIGVDGNPATLDEIESGRITATLGVYPDKMGETVLRQMKKVFNKEKIPLYLETTGVMVDKGNLADYRAGKLWEEPKASKAEIVQTKR